MHVNSIYNEINFEENSNDKTDINIPEPTNFIYLCKTKYNSCPIVKIQEFDPIENQQIKRMYCGYWECNFAFPVIVTIIVLFCYSVFLVNLFFRNNDHIILNVILLLFSLFFIILFLMTYFQAVCYDPGYLPFDWNGKYQTSDNLKIPKTKFTWREIMAGTAVRKDQFDYALNVPRPLGCSFSRTSGRYIIRADHFCSWIGNWIGIRNNKQFILIPFWGFINCLVLLILRFSIYHKIQIKSFLDYFDLTGVIIELMFAFILLMHFISLLMELFENRTMIQKYKKEEVPKLSKIESLELICGKTNKCLWLFPVSAFSGDIPLKNYAIDSVM